MAPLFGHEAAEAALVGAVRSGRLHHAWLLAGPPGIGKNTLARRFATWLLAGAPGTSMQVADDDPAGRRVRAGTHADLLTVGRAFDEKKGRHRGEIVVEDTRRVADFLRLTAAEGGWRVVVLGEAERMNRSAANALLKLLEEPPPRCVLLLASDAPGLLLPTIRSRCRLLRLAPLDAAAMDAALRHLLPELDAERRRALAPLADGSPGRAVRLAGEQAVALQELVDGLLRGGPADPRHEAAVAERVLRLENGFETFLDLLAGAISARARRAARQGTRDDREPDWTAAWQGIRRLGAEAERFNLEKRQALLSGLVLLRER